MTAIFIVLGVLLAIGILLICPVFADFRLTNSLTAKIKFLFLRINYPFNWAKKRKKITLTECKKEDGISGIVKESKSLINTAFTELKWLLKNIKFSQLSVDVSVSASNAALTAIEYGAVCAAVYPMTSLISTVLETQFKNISVSSDFSGEKSTFLFTGSVRCPLIFAIIAYVKFEKITAESKIITTEFLNKNKKDGAQNV